MIIYNFDIKNALKIYISLSFGKINFLNHCIGTCEIFIKILGKFLARGIFSRHFSQNNFRNRLCAHFRNFLDGVQPKNRT